MDLFSGKKDNTKIGRCTCFMTLYNGLVIYIDALVYNMVALKI